MIVSISWDRCSRIYSNLSPEQRACLHKHRSGEPCECPESVREQYRNLGMMAVINGVDALTPEGKVVAAFCVPQKTGES